MTMGMRPQGRHRDDAPSHDHLSRRLRRRPRRLIPASVAVLVPVALLVVAISPPAAVAALAARLPAAVALTASSTGGITVNPLQAALIAFGYYLANSPWLFGLGFFTLYRPLVAGLFVGIIMGDPAQGTLIGATINLVYLGFISAGGTLPSDPGLAGWVGTAIAIAGHLDPGQALALAVPLGLLGTLIFNLRMTADSVFAHWADARADAADISGVAWMNWVPGQVWLFLISFVPVFFLAWRGSDLVVSILDALPVWVLNGMSIAGGILPAIGIALNMRFIFRGQVIPYFFLGYLVMIASRNSIPIVLIAALGVVLAALHVTFVTDARRREVGPVVSTTPATVAAVVAPRSEAARAAAGRTSIAAGSAGAGAVDSSSRAGAVTGESEEAGGGASGVRQVDGGPTDGAGEPPRTPAAGPLVSVRRSDVIRSWVLWTFFSHANYNYERLQGTGFAHAMTPVIRRLYHTPDEIRDALRRHLVFFNTEPNFGNVIHGAVIAMEEQRATGAPIDDDAINSVKSGLMGPLAGIGDSISQGVLTPLFLAMGIGIAGARVAAGTQAAGATGNPLGPILYIGLIGVSIIAIGYVAYTQGYARGRTFVTDLLRSGAMERVLTGAGVLGNLVLGALAAQFVVVNLAPTVGLYGANVNLQLDLVDKVFPGLLPLLLVLLTWYLLQRRINPITILAVYLAVSLISAIPFFGPGPKDANDFSYSACTSSILHPYSACTPPSPSPSGSPNP